MTFRARILEIQAAAERRRREEIAAARAAVSRLTWHTADPELRDAARDQELERRFQNTHGPKQHRRGHFYERCGDKTTGGCGAISSTGWGSIGLCPRCSGEVMRRDYRF